MGLRIIGAGLGRTGTLSLKLALQDLLGAPCYHMDEVQQRPADPDVWGDAYEGTLPDWEVFLEGYQAAVDWPAAPFWREMSEAFPDAPILLSVRDADAWYKSASRTIFIALATYFAPDAPDDGWTRMGRGMMTRFSPDWFDEAAAKSAYLAYNEDVRTTAPRHRLIEWKPGDGWEPICTALGVAVPDHPFPHVNKAAETRAALGLEP
ncbi:MAG TPA: sulfotransferase [Acidimicrobiales bacterium]|nr:sulfotransferase [Acidimicrobiales bacterium]